MGRRGISTRCCQPVAASYRLRLSAPPPGRSIPIEFHFTWTLTNSPRHILCSMPQRRVSYYYDRQISNYPPQSLTDCFVADVGSYSYGIGHPMKPLRMRITHELLTAYNMLDKMDVLVSCFPPCAFLLRVGTESRACNSRSHDSVPYR